MTAAGSSPPPATTEPEFPWLGFLRIALVFGLVLLFLPHVQLGVDAKLSLCCLASGLFGASVGFVELLARYRDEPMAAISTTPARIYILLNAGVATAVFLLVYTGRLPMAVSLFEPQHRGLNAAVLAGFGGMALLRTSVANIRVNERSFQVGPALVLQVLLGFLDRAVDRVRAQTRSRRVQQVMAGVVYQRARGLLPYVATSLLQNLTLEEKNDFQVAVKTIEDDTKQTEAGKLHQLGLVLMDVLGEELLQRLVESLGERVRGGEEDDPLLPVLRRASELELGDLGALLAMCRALRLGQQPPDGEEPVWNDLLGDGTALIPEITSTTRFSAAQRVVLTLTAMRAYFGAETVAVAVNYIIGAKLPPRRPAGEGGGGGHPAGGDPGRQPEQGGSSGSGGGAGQAVGTPPEAVAPQEAVQPPDAAAPREAVAPPDAVRSPAADGATVEAQPAQGAPDRTAPAHDTSTLDIAAPPLAPPGRPDGG